jgi:tetratricopeptide (TPR) repeat protein
MRYSIDQFQPGEAWLVFRVDCLVQDRPVDIYLLMDVASTYLFGSVLAPGELPEINQVIKLMQAAHETKNAWPKKFFCPEQDPAEDLFRRIAQQEGISFEVAPLSSFERIIGPVKKSFSNHFYSPMASAGAFDDDTPPTDEQRMSQAFVPDSYDLCPCASGLKYKFCCKPIFREITHAMTAAENGHLKEALDWMEKAKRKVGETPEILCRYAIVYSFIDTVKADEYLEKCLITAPYHPRANYVRGIVLKEEGDIAGAIKAYKTAIENYPPTDRYHLNEAWNNLGTAYYDLKQYSEAKAAWEKALAYLPEDSVAAGNLNNFIYENPDIPRELRGSRRIH